MSCPQQSKYKIGQFCFFKYHYNRAIVKIHGQDSNDWYSCKLVKEIVDNWFKSNIVYYIHKNDLIKLTNLDKIKYL